MLLIPSAEGLKMIKEQLQAYSTDQLVHLVHNIK